MSDRRSSKVGNFIREWRAHRGMTLDKVAEQIGYSKMSISRWERRTREVTTDQMQRLADALGCSLYDLLFRPPDEGSDGAETA